LFSLASHHSLLAFDLTTGSSFHRQLLEEHFAAARREQDLDSNASFNEEEQDAADANGWNDWEVESESGSDSSGGWQSVSSDSEHDIDFSDSDDDEAEKAKRRASKGKGKAGEGEDEDVNMDAKSEGGATDMSEGKKLSLLATQKVRRWGAGCDRH
jgi:protein SDA1